jgi:hypothetical protein
LLINATIKIKFKEINILPFISNILKKFFSQALPHGELHRCDAGKLPQNVPKNRFKTTFPCNEKSLCMWFFFS